MAKTKENPIWRRTSSAGSIAAAFSSIAYATIAAATTGATNAASALNTALRKVSVVVKDSFGRRKIQRKQTPYKGRNTYQIQGNRERFYTKVRATHSDKPDPRNLHFWHAYARNQKRGIVTA